jgi:hypothetical protein
MTDMHNLQVRLVNIYLTLWHEDLKNNAGIAIFILFGVFSMKSCENVHISFDMFVCPSVCLHVTTQELLYEFSWHLI